MRSAPARRPCTGPTDGDDPMSSPEIARARETSRRDARRSRGRLSRLGRWPARKRLALAAIVLVGLAYATMFQNWSDNQSSHYDLIRALDAGRTTIDYGPYPTKDKAKYKGHYYSARAPGLAIYSLPFYEALRAVNAPALARDSQALRGEDEMIDFVGLWGSVLPALLL